MSQPIIPVILCGGSGTRLWPLSRASYPKQFNRILGERSLFQSSVERLPVPDFAAPIVVTNSEFRFIATEQLAQIGRAPGAVLIEPDGRNTAPAVLAAALKAAETAPDGFLLVCPSDHAIADAAAFGYGSMRLDSGPFMTSAHRLYEAEGFRDCPRYDGAEVPSELHDNWRFMERPLP